METHPPTPDTEGSPEAKKGWLEKTLAARRERFNSPEFAESVNKTIDNAHENMKKFGSHALDSAVSFCLRGPIKAIGKLVMEPYKVYEHNSQFSEERDFLKRLLDEKKQEILDRGDPKSMQDFHALKRAKAEQKELELQEETINRQRRSYREVPAEAVAVIAKEYWKGACSATKMFTELTKFLGRVTFATGRFVVAK